MKTSIRMVFFILLISLLTGCTDIALKSKTLEQAIIQLKETLVTIENKENISAKDQETVKVQVEYFQQSFKAFQNEEVPSFLTKAHKKSIARLSLCQDFILPLKERAGKKRLTKSDIVTARKALSEDFNLSIFHR
ncbi:hypothetical protein ACLM5H_18225 [Fredinandcohnia humi]